MKRIRKIITYIFSVVLLASLMQLSIFFISHGLKISDESEVEKTGNNKLLDEHDLEVPDEIVMLRPDLVPLKPRDFRVWRRNGKVELRFTAGFWNKGKGPFEIIGTSTLATNRDQKFEAYQRVTLNDKGTLDFSTGELFWHAVHKHYHMENVARYVLEPLGGNKELAIHQKTSFCLADIATQDLKVPGAPKRRVYATTCNLKKQGISIGWADIYYHNFPGQGMDITNLPPGDYRLSVIIDPDGTYIEESKENNTESVVLNLNPRTMKWKIVTTSSS